MRLKLVTYNILANAYVKRDRYPHSSPEALDPTSRRARLLDCIAALDADVLCLQEVEPEAFEAIRSRLGRPGVLARPSDRPDGLAVIHRAGLAARMVELVEPSFGRGNTLVAQIARFDGFSVANMHLRWRPDDTPDADHIGLQQLRRVLDVCDGEPGPWILAGDFNAISQSRVIAEAERRGYHISCRAQRPWDTTNINGRRRKIDYLLHTPAHWRPEPGVLPELGRRTPMPSLQHASDHLPLEVVFERV